MMAWIPSHDTLGTHPKTRRAARLAGCSVPAMMGHLHLLWHWALGVALDGDLSRFDAADLADAAMWEGDPEVFETALVECGPGESEGFLTADGRLHDWDEYGGKYGARSAAGKKGAETRWGKVRAAKEAQEDAEARAADQAEHATAMRPHSGPNGTRNAEERRGEESSPTSTLTTTEVVEPTPPVPVVVDEQQIRACAVAVGRAIAAQEFPRPNDPAAFAAGVTKRILTGDDPHDRDRIRTELAAGSTSDDIADSWTETAPDRSWDPFFDRPGSTHVEQVRPALKPFTGHDGPGPDETIPDPLERVRALRPTATEGAKA